MSMLETLDAAAEAVYAHVPPTPQYVWPLLAEEAGCELWLKHENHLPIGSFKVRGGLVYASHLRASDPECPGIVTATRGNHGQSIGYACRRLGLRAKVLVPRGNSTEKNAAMRALGAELVEHGRDFQEAREEAERLARAEGWRALEPFHEILVGGVASYPLELLRAAPQLERVYVPIGMGSGICATIAARDALGLATEVVGVVAESAPAYALSFRAGEPVSTPTAETIADGLAVRAPHPEAVAVIRKGAADVISVSEAEIRAAMRLCFRGTHNVAEGAGAAALAAVLQQRGSLRGTAVAAVLSGGNVDTAVFRDVLAEA